MSGKVELRNPRPSPEEPAKMYVNHNACTTQQHHVHKQSSNSDAYAFFNLLMDKHESLLPKYWERLFPPTETLSIFMAQALSADRSCQNAVNAVTVQSLTGGLPQCSRYATWRGRGNPVRLIDGTTVTPLPDTPTNQAAYPQSCNQKPGLGFPLCRIVGLL